MSLKARLKGRSHGKDGKKASERIKNLEFALKIIYTWASVYGALDPEHVRKLCGKALRIEDGKNGNT